MLLHMASGKGDLFYANEKISSAVETLATSHGTLQERLLNAWMSEGHHALPMGPGQAGAPMSDELIGRLEALNARMSCEPAKGNEGTFAATILSFSDDEASATARELLDIGFQIESELNNL